MCLKTTSMMKVWTDQREGFEEILINNKDTYKTNETLYVHSLLFH